MVSDFGGADLLSCRPIDHFDEALAWPLDDAQKCRRRQNSVQRLRKQQQENETRRLEAAKLIVCPTCATTSPRTNTSKVMGALLSPLPFRLLLLTCSVYITGTLWTCSSTSATIWSPFRSSSGQTRRTRTTRPSSARSSPSLTLWVDMRSPPRQRAHRGNSWRPCATWRTGTVRRLATQHRKSREHTSNLRFFVGALDERMRATLDGRRNTRARLTERAQRPFFEWASSLFLNCIWSDTKRAALNARRQLLATFSSPIVKTK